MATETSKRESSDDTRKSRPGGGSRCWPAPDINSTRIVSQPGAATATTLRVHPSCRRVGSAELRRCREDRFEREVHLAVASVSVLVGLPGSMVRFVLVGPERHERLDRFRDVRVDA